MNATPNREETPGIPAGYPEENIDDITLLDGTRVTIRPIRPSDAAGLQAGFRRLSPESIYFRFLETFSQLSDQQAEYFVNVDYQTRMAFVGEIDENGQKNLIAVARYAVTGDAQEGVAESAIVIVDEYQNRGLGAELLDRLIHYARSHGIKIFIATVHLSNARIMHFIRRSGFPFKKNMLEPGIWEIHIDLTGENG